jgi:hypothetical protein
MQGASFLIAFEPDIAVPLPQWPMDMRDRTAWSSHEIITKKKHVKGDVVLLPWKMCARSQRVSKCVIVGTNPSGNRFPISSLRIRVTRDPLPNMLDSE